VYDRHIFSEDITSAVRYSLLHEVALHHKITGDTLKALAKFVGTLGNFFPGDDQLRRDLTKLSKVLSDGRETVTSDEWLKLVEPIFENVQDLKFVSCVGSQPKYRGYPCSLWTLFHAMTVEAVNVGDGAKYRDVVDGVHGFVKHFFSCRYCSKHFDEMYKETAGDVVDLKSGVVWLWSAHNKVRKCELEFRIIRDHYILHTIDSNYQ
jgi:thiol oxidase